jgi:Xaa-Pro aminopeptidase
MVVTVEPGVYLPGLGGVRLEELVLLTESGVELLSRFPRDFQEL